jgi:hypothetical protein
LHRANHGRVRVADDGRSPCADVVDVLGAIGAEHVRPVGLLDEDRVAADSTESAGGTVDASRDGHPGAFEELFGYGVHGGRV